jgi:hypothetical protein
MRFAGTLDTLTLPRLVATMRINRSRTVSESPMLVVSLNAVIIAITDEQPRVLTVAVPDDVAIENIGRFDASTGGHRLPALPSGPLDPAGDRTLELALRRWVRASTGLELGYVEQLYTFGDRFRSPGEASGGARVVSAAYLALVRESVLATGMTASWRSMYRFLPWEDWRSGRPEIVERAVVPCVTKWVQRTDDRLTVTARAERAGVTFGVEGGIWDGERVLDRYELLYELGLVAESARDQGRSDPEAAPDATGAETGVEMAFDHRRILASALGRIRAKIKYRPVIFELMPETFTLFELQRAVEALAGVRLHKQNFRRLVEQGGLVEGTGTHRTHTGGRPAELFRFRRDVLLERPAPGVGLPGIRR